MSVQLFQLLAQLDRPGATELVVATGRQVALRIPSGYQPLTTAAVTLPQLMHLIRDTQLAALVPASEEVGDPVAIDLDGRPLRAQFIRQGSDVLLRIEHRQPPARPSPPPARPAPPSRPTPVPPAALRPPARPTDPAHDHEAAAAHATRPRHTTPPHGSAVAVPQIAVRTSGPTPAPPLRDPARRAPEPADALTLIDEPSTVVPALAGLVADARRMGATDLHLAANRPVLVRTLGDLVTLDPAPRSAADVEALVMPLLGPVRRRQLAERGYVDLGVDVPGGGRLRTNVSRQQGGLKGAFRLAVARPPALAELGLPAAVARVTEHHQGLVVIAGPSGHGKTTTLAALIDLLNRADPIHILTIEDPVEIVHPRQAAVVSQREVGRHTLSFAAALKASLREDPDVIVIGELRDRETVEIALTAAETGHLVLATMSTPSAAKTIDRLIDMFPPDEQSQVRASLGAALKAIVAQRLLPDAQGTGMVAVVELLVGVLALANLIRDNKLFQLPNLMQRGRAFGMLRLDDSLLELVRAGRLAEDVALRAADNKKELAAALHPAPPPPEPARRGLFGRKERE
ncbi:MAG: PilT/PilU family type 4a pilus ATPase [Deltaproteobacteria bacterium]|nr:MAG: PilT/PilU family type 4a pilus ATPase [Deltaproteobacteria bacterium]TMQ22428.1 MAG: PilT/PilU family type 4a pilus ATPase [Deltaproteobacteria bacterium]